MLTRPDRADEPVAGRGAGAWIRKVAALARGAFSSTRPGVGAEAGLLSGSAAAANSSDRQPCQIGASVKHTSSSSVCRRGGVGQPADRRWLRSAWPRYGGATPDGAFNGSGAEAADLLRLGRPGNRFARERATAWPDSNTRTSHLYDAGLRRGLPYLAME